MDRQLFKETFSVLRASPDTIKEVLKMANGNMKQKTRRAARTGLIAALAAVLLMGAAFAAANGLLRADPVGELGVAVSVGSEDGLPGAVAFSGAADEVEFYYLDLEAGWLPEGMTNVPGETVKWHYEDDFRGGFSVESGPLNAGSASFCDLVTDVEVRESIEIDGHEAFYIRQTDDYGYGFSQYLYISYPEFNAVLTIRIGSNIDRDTAVKFAENLRVTPSDQTIGAGNLEYIGRRYQDMANYIATGVYVNTADGEDGLPTLEEMEAILAGRDPANRAIASDMADAHEIGESFPVSFLDFGGGHRDGPFVDLTVKVTDISVRDDYGALRDPQYLDQDWAGRVDENGRLPRADYEFVVYGDGVNTPSITTVATLPDQQLYMAAVTVEITNDTDETVRYAGYSGKLLSIAETKDGWTVTEPESGDPAVEYDDGYCTGGGRLYDMRYWDLRAENDGGGNAITNLAPGESVTIQMGFIVSECQLGDLWFYLNDMDAETTDEIHAGYVPVS